MLLMRYGDMAVSCGRRCSDKDCGANSDQYGETCRSHFSRPCLTKLLPVSRTRHGARSDNGWQTDCLWPDDTKLFYRREWNRRRALLIYGSALEERQPVGSLSRAPTLPLGLLFRGALQRRTNNQIIHYGTNAGGQLPGRISLRHDPDPPRSRVPARHPREAAIDRVLCKYTTEHTVFAPKAGADSAAFAGQIAR